MSAVTPISPFVVAGPMLAADVLTSDVLTSDVERGAGPHLERRSSHT